MRNFIVGNEYYIKFNNYFKIPKKYLLVEILSDEEVLLNSDKKFIVANINDIAPDNLFNKIDKYTKVCNEIERIRKRDRLLSVIKEKLSSEINI